MLKHYSEEAGMPDVKVGARNNQQDLRELSAIKNKATEIIAHVNGIVGNNEYFIVGEPVKFVSVDEGRIGGYLVRFSSSEDPDLVGDYFTKNTDFGTIYTTNILYQHGQDPIMQTKSLGVGTWTKDDIGIWLEAQLNLSDEYEKAILQLVDAGKLRWSSGTASHLVQRERVGKSHWVKSWHLGLDASLTPTPAEPRNEAIRIKATEELTKGEIKMTNDIEIMEPIVVETITTEKEPDTQMGNLENMVKSLAEQQEQMATRFSQLMQTIEKAPVQRLGYISPDGGSKDAHLKSLGDFAASVYRKDYKRLETVYSVKLHESTGDSGGFLVPAEFEPRIMRAAIESSIVRPRADVRAIRGREIVMPAFDYSGAFVDGATTALAGMTMDWVAEEATISTTSTLFRQMHMITHKMGRVIPISSELMRDSILALEQTITGMFGDAIAFSEDWHFLRGDGVGKPLGVYNSDCLITTSTALTTTSVKLSEILTMFARLPEESKSRAVWVAHTTLLPALMAMNSENAGSIPMVPDVARPGRYTLLGLPLIFTEKVPETFATGGLLLADFSQYYIVDSGGVEIAISDQVYFSTDQVGIRVTKRIDGQAKWNAARKVGKAATATVSPFVLSK